MAQKWRLIKRKSGAKKKVKVTKAYEKRRKQESSSKWTSVKMNLFEKGDHRPKSWLRISRTGLVYISRSPGTRTYWVLSKIPRKQWPKFRWSDRNLSFSVNSTRVVFKKSVDYMKAKKSFEAIRPPKY